jgi:hypothetical protein
MQKGGAALTTPPPEQEISTAADVSWLGKEQVLVPDVETLTPELQKSKPAAGVR